MNPYLRSFLLVLLGILCLTPERSEAQKFSVGAQVAGSVNNSYGQGTDSYLSTPIYGGSLGAFGTYDLFGKFKIRAEALISTRGFNSQYSSTGATSASLSGSAPTLPSDPNTQSTGSGADFTTLKLQTMYFDVPVSAVYEVIPNVNLQAGGIFSFFMNEYSSSLSNGSTVSQPRPADTQYYQTFQFYLFGGAYYQFPFGLQAGGRFNVGLSQTFVPASSGTGNQIYPYNFQVFVAYPLLKF